MPVRRPLRLLLAAVLLLPAVAPLSAVADPPGDGLTACRTKGQVTVRDDGWTELRAPAYAEGYGDAMITTSAVSTLPRRLYVTNGTAVQVSTDAGCRWHQIYPAPTTVDDVAAASGAIVTHLAAGGTTLWTVGYLLTDGVPRPRVAVTNDATPTDRGGPARPFLDFGGGLPAVGRPVAFEVSPGMEESPAYLLVEEPNPTVADPAATVRRLYRTMPKPGFVAYPLDVWQPVGLPSGFGPVAGLAAARDLALWIWSGSDYAVLRNNETWERGNAGGPVSRIQVERSSTEIYAAGPDGPVGLRVHVGAPAGPPTARPLPVLPTASTRGSRGGVVAIAGGNRTFGFDVAARRWVELSPAGGVPFARLHMAQGASGAALLGETPHAMFRRDLLVWETFVPPPDLPDVPQVDYAVKPPTLSAPRLRVGHREVTVAPGERRSVPVALGVPPTPSPLDVFFLADTTMSMAESLRALRRDVRGIAREVRRRTLGSACFGVGEFKDFTPSGEADTRDVYRRHLPLTCEGAFDALDEAVGRLHQSGGSMPEAEAGTLAITAAVTGKASVVPPLTGELAAGFTARSRVVVVISDAGFMEGTTPQGTYPTVEETVRTLKANGDVKVVSILVRTSNDEAAAREDLEALVGGTGTFAPAGGVDCDGNGRIDLAAGAPLVCPSTGEHTTLGPAIVALLLAVRDPGPVGLRVRDPHDVVVAGAAGVQATLNLRAENHLRTALTVTCAPAQAGRDLGVGVAGTVRGQAVARGGFVVRCRAPAVPRAVPPEPEPEPGTLPGPVPRAAIAVAPVPYEVAPNPNTNPNPDPHPGSNANPNAGVAGVAQEQERAVPAVVAPEPAPGADELAMTAVRRDDPAAVLVLGCAGVVGAATAAAYARRRRTRVAPAYARGGR